MRYEEVLGALQAAEPAVRRNQRLIRLKEEEPVVAPDDLVMKAPDKARLRELFSGWGFRSMLAALGEPAPAPEQGALL